MATKKKKKTSSLLSQAKKLGASKYAPVLKEIELNSGTNTKLYTNAGTQRKSAIDREIGSIHAAGATSKRMIGETGATNQSMYQKAIGDSQNSTKDLLSQVGQNQSNMLSSLQAEIKNRGGSPDDYAYLSPLTRGSANANNTLAAVGELNRGALERQSTMAGTQNSTLQVMADQMATTGASKARGAAQANMDELYTKWLERSQELETAQAKTKLEKGDYINQTYLTLKEKAAQAKAEKAQAALQAAIAQGNLNYKNTALKVNTQYKYDALSAKTAQNDITNKLKSLGFSHKKALELARLGISKQKLGLDIEKFDWQKANPTKSAAINLSDLIAAGN